MRPDVVLSAPLTGGLSQQTVYMTPGSRIPCSAGIDARRGQMRNGKTRLLYHKLTPEHVKPDVMNKSGSMIVVKFL